MNTTPPHDFLADGLYIQKIADVTGVPVEYIARLRDHQALDERAVRSMLIRQDAAALISAGRFTAGQVYERIADIYNIPVSTLRKIISIKPRRYCYCRTCGAPIPKDEHDRNGGLCDRCFTRTAVI